MLTSVSVYHVETHYIYTQPRGVIPVPHDVIKSFTVGKYKNIFLQSNIKMIFFCSKSLFLVTKEKTSGLNVLKQIVRQIP